MKTIITTISSVNLQKLRLAFMLLSLLIAVPFLVHNQWYTGTLVNGILIMTLLTVGLREAVLFCFVPSIIVFATGALPSPLVPIIPFIMASNLILILTVYLGQKRKIPQSLSILSASGVKFLFLFLSLLYVMPFLVAENLLVKVSAVFGIMQLLTALSGGVLALVVIKLFRLEKNKTNA